ncbi:DUF1116 domain-containing protein [Terrihabitans rhizophilus]|uniref:DUF1116 domain-containing protein n=1 Tax=Terrihabitans rhizophilus TaxID=3092662 RepID=A0ABU4RKG2_9HYPH|nr:DUF1116 domain-containing protein [Terrihabitans sp. PJ23]MDX6804688.1 DUF1116 domain-containing protein [Terrihabitans sp. PJ23]
MTSHDRTETANRQGVDAILAVDPIIREPVLARDALGLAEGELGHAGPPFEDAEAPPVVVLNALAGAAVHEGWAGDMDSARRMVLGGEIRLRHNHGLGTVSPMSGVVRPGQRLFRIEDGTTGRCTFATLAEKGRHVLRFGYYNQEVAEGLRFVEGPVADALALALPTNGLRILPLLKRGVDLGDDIHQRNVGGMLSFLAALPDLPGSVRTWLDEHPQHFLNYAMASAKLCLDAARGIEGSSIVTAISRNGLSCGIQLAATGDHWFTAPADLPVGGFFPPFSIADAHGDLGDSAIMETYGLGGCVAHASPELAASMQRTWLDAQEAGARMRSLFVQHSRTISPALAGAEGVGVGLDARRVAASGAGVRIHTGIAHRDGVQGWIGIGVAQAPLECFTKAVDRLDHEVGRRDV